ncbi:type I polyketide synthase, partial [Desulfovibrio sp. OttesenSCG-928-G11]|nr:type I polyketide synthase [Desulfovibrio sp. OttesenSCG-928-G11]
MKESHTEALAIIGAACRLPGDVSDLASLWTLLEEGRDAVSELPPDRFSLDRYFSQAPDLPGHAYTRAAGVIKNAKDFDADFFPLPHKESMDMDPQQRLLLEMAWETMESAGLTASSLRGSGTGVYIGASTVDSSLRGQDGPETIGMYSTIGASLAVLANRLSYVYDWHGPSQVAETACSSALVALHNACEALRAGHISLAMVGAVNLLFSPFPFICLSKAHMLSPDGRCKPFDAAANGYVRAEGGGMILVKPLEAARRDNDKVLAIIAASGINSDGRTNGLPLPNPEAQSDLLRDIYDRHRLDVGKLAYVEAHGTGTAAGDPVEALALGRVLGRRLRRRRPLYMGSIKSNVGHLEPAAGMAGLLKALLVLQKNIIPPSLHFNRPNPHIDFKGLNLKVPTCPTPLPLRGPQTLVGVNSFGFGGTNAHVVLQRAPAQRGARPRAAQLPPMPPFFLSARSAQSLSALARSLAGSLENSPDGQLENAGQPALYDTACTLIKNREHLRVRAVLVPADKENLPEALRKLASGIDSGKGKAALEAVGENCPAAFVFSGNGSQWLGMGKSMLRENAVFAAALEEVQEMLRPLGGAPIIEALQSPEKFPDQTQHTELGQPLLFAMQVGLVRALAAKGIAPGAVFGHSVGEVAAAWTAGALSLRDACAVVHFRSKLQSRFKDQGLMAVAAVSPDEASTVLEQYQGRVEITAWNAPASITLAGEAEAVTLCVRDWKQQGVTAKTLPLPYPFHTRRMEELREEFSASIASIRPQKARLPFYAAAQDPDLPFKADQAYWWRNMRQPVHFFQAARSALDNGFRLFLEIGPRPVLGGYLQEIIKDKKVTARALPSLLYSGNEAKQFEKAWQDAWKNGWPLDAKALVRAPYRPVELPVYAWDRRPHWVEPTPEFKGLLNRQRQHPLLGWAVGQLPVFENIIGLGDFPWLADHRAGDAVLLPAAAFVEIFLAAARALHPADPRELERLVLYRPIHFGKDGAMHIRVLADEDDGSLRLEGRPYMSGDKWSLFARTRMKPASRPRNARSLPAAPGPGDRLLDSAEIYARAQAHHLHYGPAFQTLQEAWLRKDDAGTEIVTRLNAPLPESAEGMHIFPTLLDGAFQALLPLLDLERDADRGAGGGEAWLPASFGNTALFSESVAVRSVARLRRVGRRSALADITLFDAEGQVSAALDGCLFRRSAWLENPGDRPAGYVMHALPRPERDQRAAPLDPDEVCRLASAPLLRASAEKEAANARTRGVTTAELLRFTALKYAHESLSALSDGPF